MISQRTELLVGSNAISRLEKASVAIIGLGGVGSFAAEAIARSGIGKILVMDSDKVEASNLNRQLYALHSSMDQPKAELAKKRILDINPLCDVTAIEDFYNPSSENSFLEYDYIIDCIDSFSSKLHLVKELLHHKKSFVTSMGAAGKMDVGSVKLVKLHKTIVCPLARKMRKSLRKEGFSEKFHVVYSTEIPVKARDGAPQASMIYVPAVFGLTLANWVCKQIIE